MEWSEFLGVGSDSVSHKLSFFQAYLKISCPSFFFPFFFLYHLRRGTKASSLETHSGFLDFECL